MNEGVVITTDLLLLLSVTIIQILCFLHNLTCIILIRVNLFWLSLYLKKPNLPSLIPNSYDPRLLPCPTYRRDPTQGSPRCGPILVNRTTG